MKITLYTHGLSPYGMKVYWALIFKNLPFEVVCVSPRGVPEIEFTGQTVVPVVKVDDNWKLDSTPIIHWLDSLFPERPLSSDDPEQASAIAAIDHWANERLIPSMFRHATDGENLWHLLHTGFLLGSTMRKTTGQISPVLYPFWGLLLRRAKFIQNLNKKVSHFKTLEEMNNAIMKQLEQHIGSGPFLGGHSQLTLADATVYAQLHCILMLGFKGQADYLSSAVVRKWILAVESKRPAITEFPQLYPGMLDTIL